MNTNQFRLMLLVVSGTVAAPLLARPAGAQAIVPITQDRSVQTGGFVEACGFAQDLDAIENAPDFGLFDTQVLGTVDCAQAHGVAIGHQRSSIGGSLITVSGGAHAESAATLPNTIFIGAASDFNVTFELTEESEFTLDGRLSGLAIGSSSVFWGANVGLTANPGPNSEVIVVRSIGANGDALSSDQAVLSESGVLAPGVYGLFVSSQSIIDAPFDPNARVTSSFRLDFAVTAVSCAGDTDGDGDVDLADLAILLGEFGMVGQGLPGDVDGDGDVDLADLASVLGNFGTICA